MADRWNAWMNWFDALPWHHPAVLVVAGIPLLVLVISLVIFLRKPRAGFSQGRTWR